MTEQEPNRFLDLNAEDLAPLGGTVRIGERNYRTLDPDRMGLVEVGELQQLEQRFARAMRRYQQQPSDRKAGREAEAMLDAMLRLVVPDLPAEELGKLGYLKKAKLYAFFGGKLADFQRAIGGATSPSTTPTSSPDSPSTTDSATGS